MQVDLIEYILKDPDRRAKLYLVAVGAIIMSTVLIVLGTFILLARYMGLI